MTNVRRTRVALLVLGALALAGASSAAPALASSAPAPAWRLTAEALPSSVPAAGRGLLLLHLQNVGDAPSVAGAPIAVVDQLPAGLTATRAAGVVAGATSLEPSGLWGECEIAPTGRTVTCTYRPGATIAPAAGTRRLPPGTEGVVGTDALAPAIGIEIGTEPLSSGSLVDTAVVSGGGSPVGARHTMSLSVRR